MCLYLGYQSQPSSDIVEQRGRLLFPYCLLHRLSRSQMRSKEVVGIHQEKSGLHYGAGEQLHHSRNAPLTTKNVHFLALMHFNLAQFARFVISHRKLGVLLKQFSSHLDSLRKVARLCDGFFRGSAQLSF